MSAGLTHPQLKTGSARSRYHFFTGVATPSQQNFQATQETMQNTKFLVKVVRGTRAAEYVQRIDRSPVQTTLKRNLALAMGKLTAEDVVNSLGNSRCIPELVPIQVTE
jgi:hypothetical protein